MAVAAVDERMLLAPGTLFPVRAPSGPVTVDKRFGNAKLIYCPQVAGTANIAPLVGTGITSPYVLMPITGNITAHGTPWGMCHRGTTTGDYILSGIGPNDGEHLSTALVVTAPKPHTAEKKLFSTRVYVATPTRYAGFYAAYSNTGAIWINYGDATGTGTADRRSLNTTDEVVSLTLPTAWCGHFLTSTTGLLYANGIKQSLTASGTGGALGGSGNIYVHDIHALNATDWADILLLVLFNYALPESEVESLSRDPFQIFLPA